MCQEGHVSIDSVLYGIPGSKSEKVLCKYVEHCLDVGTMCSFLRFHATQCHTRYGALLHRRRRTSGSPNSCETLGRASMTRLLKSQDVWLTTPAIPKVARKPGQVRRPWTTWRATCRLKLCRSDFLRMCARVRVCP